jgi:hypothetical protein
MLCCTLGAYHACRCCGLELNSLEPLAQLSSLRGLRIQGEPEAHPLQSVALAGLLTTAGQGDQLQVYLSSCVRPEVAEECRQARAALVKERGGLSVPRLEISPTS